MTPTELQPVNAAYGDALREIRDRMRPGRWFRINKPDGSLWMETSNEEEARATAKETGWPLERIYTVNFSEWRIEGGAQGDFVKEICALHVCLCHRSEDPCTNFKHDKSRGLCATCFNSGCRPPESVL